MMFPAFAQGPRVGLGFDHGAVVISVPRGLQLRKEAIDVALELGPGSLSVGPLPRESAFNDEGEPVYWGDVRIPVRGEGLRGQVKLIVHLAVCGDGAWNTAPEWKPLMVNAAWIPKGPVPPELSVCEGANACQVTVSPPARRVRLRDRARQWVDHLAETDPASSAVLGPVLIFLARFVDILWEAPETQACLVLLLGMALLLHRGFTAEGRRSGGS